jgi:hypothetical protein
MKKNWAIAILLLISPEESSTAIFSPHHQVDRVDVLLVGLREKLKPRDVALIVYCIPGSGTLNTFLAVCIKVVLLSIALLKTE